MRFIIMDGPAGPDVLCQQMDLYVGSKAFPHVGE
jgi:hypothetical protein